MAFSLELRYRTGATETFDMPSLTDDSTEYEYSYAVATLLVSSIEKRQAVFVAVYRDSVRIHALRVIPKGDSVMVTDNTADTHSLSFQFAKTSELLPEKYLVMVNAERNNNKFYRMVDLGNGTFNVFYGRIGESQGTSRFANHIETPFTYRAYMYYIKYYEKVTKGYEDKSDLHKNMAQLTKKTFRYDFDGMDSSVSELLKFLMARSKQFIEKNYTIRAEDVTENMYKSAEIALDKLKEATDKETFNQRLIELMHIIPRRTERVSYELAYSENEFGKIIMRETNLLEVVKGQVLLNQKSVETISEEQKKNILDVLNLEIYPATEKQTEEVRNHLSPELSARLTRAYRVINKTTQKRFDEFLRKNGNCAVKQLWHGSVTENWFSILQQGLVVNPNAVITGKMFGKGIYFAPSAKKAWGYTSALGSYWKNGRENKAFMGLFATAYGNPYKVKTNSQFNSSFSIQDFKRLAPNCDCVHAERGVSLANDEIVFYDESQTTLNYICEFVS